MTETFSNIFDEIKSKISLVTEIESRGISLTPSGRQRLRCRCPLPKHNDGSPSFFVSLNDDPELFHCFGCKKGGSIIDFVMYYGEDGNSELTKKDAVKYLIKKYKLENLISFDIDRISAIPNKYKKEELPLISKALLTSEDIRKYLQESLNIKTDFNKIIDYNKNIDESLHESDYPNLNALEDLVNKALKSNKPNEIYNNLKIKCKKCSLCDLRLYCRNSVFGFGNFNSTIFIVGDYVTNEESRNNRPFSDDAGLFFIEELLKYINNPFDLWFSVCQSCCSLKPSKEFAKKCSEEHLIKHINTIKPKLIITSGNIAKEILSEINYENKIINIEDYREIYLNGVLESDKYAVFSESLKNALQEKS